MTQPSAFPPENDSLRRTTKARTWLLYLLIIILPLTSVQTAAASRTVVRISAELGTGIAADLFPVTLSLSPENVFLTEPVVLFNDPVRIAMQVRFQAYDHRPQQHIAISETGSAAISGRLGFDATAHQVLLYDARLDSLQFDKQNAETSRLTSLLKSAWSRQLLNPIRADIPPHPYLLPFKNNIQDLSYNGKNIELTLVYE